MYRRHFTSVSIGIRHCIALIALSTLTASSPNVAAQSQIAQDTYAIFEATCLNCHGPDGAFRETLLMEHSELIDGGSVVPGNPNASELYKRLLGPTENGAQMPFNLPQLPVQSIEVVRRWILAGAPDWTIAPTTLRRFITPREVLTSIESHLNSLSSFDRSFARYFTMTHLYNAAETPGDTRRIPLSALQVGQQPLVGKHYHQPATHRPPSHHLLHRPTSLRMGCQRWLDEDRGSLSLPHLV